MLNMAGDNGRRDWNYTRHVTPGFDRIEGAMRGKSRCRVEVEDVFRCNNSANWSIVTGRKLCEGECWMVSEN